MLTTIMRFVKHHNTLITNFLQNIIRCINRFIIRENRIRNYRWFCAKSLIHIHQRLFVVAQKRIIRHQGLVIHAFLQRCSLFFDRRLKTDEGIDRARITRFFESVGCNFKRIVGYNFLQPKFCGIVERKQFQIMVLVVNFFPTLHRHRFSHISNPNQAQNSFFVISHMKFVDFIVRFPPAPKGSFLYAFFAVQIIL